MTIWRKRIAALLLACLSCFVLAISATAEENPADKQVNRDNTISVTVFNSEEELQCALEEQQQINPRAAFVGCFLARNGNTKDCEVYLKWSGGSRYDGWRFKKLTITNFSATNPVTYGTIKASAGQTYRTYNVDSASTGTVKLGDVKVPTNVDEVKCKFDSLQGSLSANTDWLSVLITSSTPIN